MVISKLGENLAEIMKGELPNPNQRNLLRPILKELINPKHQLAILAHRIDWKHFEESFSSLYFHTGHPSMPIRTMVGFAIKYQEETKEVVGIINRHLAE